MAVNFAKCGATARVAADKRGVTGSQPQIHDSPRDVRRPQLRKVYFGRRNCYTIR